MPKSLYAFIWQVSHRQQIWLALLTIVVALLTMVPLELQRRIVDEAIERADLSYVLALCGIYLVILLVQGGLKYLLNVHRGKLVEKTVLNLRETIFRHFAFHPERLDKPHQAGGAIDKGAIVAMNAAEAEEVSGFVGDAFSFPLLHGGTALATLGYLFWIEPKIAIFAFLLYLPRAWCASWAALSCMARKAIFHPSAWTGASAAWPRAPFPPACSSIASNSS
jgi:ABC-type multidrug transport system fused ATPase/permease subunit